MKTLKLFAVAALAMLAVACGNTNTTEHAHHNCSSEKNPLAGAWIGADSVGFVLTNCGKAKSINNDTLCLESYKVDSTGFTLMGKIVSNGDTLAFAETYTMAPDSTNLILLKDGSIAWCLSRPNAKCSDESCTHDHAAEAKNHEHHEGCNHNHDAEKHEGCNHNHGAEKHEGCNHNHENCNHSK